MKEEYYVRYIESVHNLAEDNSSTKALKEYTLHRDKMLIVASEKVVKAMFAYEEKAVGKQCDEHDKYLTKLVAEIRKALSMCVTEFMKMYQNLVGG